MIDLFDRIIKQRLQLRKETGNSIRDDDMLNTLIDISEQNNEEMNKTKMERLFVVGNYYFTSICCVFFN